MTVDCESVCNQVMKQQPYELRRRLYIMFKGEEGLDYGGIARLVVLHRSFSVTSVCRLITPADCSELTSKCHYLFHFCCVHGGCFLQLLRLLKISALLHIEFTELISVIRITFW